LSTKQNHDGIALCRDKAKKEYIFDSTIVTLKSSFAKLMLWVKTDFFMTGSNEMVDDMGARRSTA
jgi:hypothetical protein